MLPDLDFGILVTFCQPISVASMPSRNNTVNLFDGKLTRLNKQQYFCSQVDGTVGECRSGPHRVKKKMVADTIPKRGMIHYFRMDWHYLWSLIPLPLHEQLTNVTTTVVLAY